jgi:dTDP-4-dehydrorhamnose 3,5-epimerase
MRFRETAIPGVWVIDVEPASDERGLFARTFDAALFAERRLGAEFVQCSTSFNDRAGTLRGLHYQAPPHGEQKIVRCTAGAIFDVLVDLRPDSATHTRWEAVELSSDNRRAVHVPRGVAHGFLTLADASEVLYMMDTPHRPEAARGVRWDDPCFAIEWPNSRGELIISDRDRSYPDYAVHRSA